jgi:hypothetical protein
VWNVYNQKQRVDGRRKGFLFQNLPTAESSQRLTIRKKYYPDKQIIASFSKVFPSIVNGGRKKEVIFHPLSGLFASAERVSQITVLMISVLIN